MQLLLWVLMTHAYHSLWLCLSQLLSDNIVSSHYNELGLRFELFVHSFVFYSIAFLSLEIIDDNDPSNCTQPSN
jgi:hypothetical protein